jgi:hypothetical protein
MKPIVVNVIVVFSFLSLSCASLPQRCAEIPADMPFTLAGTTQSQPFSDAVFLRQYHGASIAPAERLITYDAEPPVRATVALVPQCDASRSLATRLYKATLSRISGYGHYSDTHNVYIIDCLCSMQTLSAPTPEQVSRLFAP